MPNPPAIPWSMERLLEENLLQCGRLVRLPRAEQDRAFMNIRTFVTAHALQRGLSLRLAREEGLRFEQLSRGLVRVLSLFQTTQGSGR